MTAYVVDSSVVAKWVLPESDTPLANQFAAHIRSQRESLIILDLARVETAKAIWKQFHRRLITVAEANKLMAILTRLPVAIQQAEPLLAVGQAIALKYDRAVYDALFVALAQHLHLPGITADEPLWMAVKADFPQITVLRDWSGATP
jgi:predicted nucleic acid-binding protein